MRGMGKAVIGVFLWLLLGTLVYYLVGNCFSQNTCENGSLVEKAESCGWNLAQSFYYSVQAGLSIGFGLLAETNDYSRLYTVFHIICGSSFIGGALGFFAQWAITTNDSARFKNQSDISEVLENCATDSYGQIPLAELRRLLLNHPRLVAEIYRKLGNDDEETSRKVSEFKEARLSKRQEIVDDLLQSAKKNLPSFYDGKWSTEDLALMHDADRRIFGRLREALSWCKREMAVFFSFCFYIGVGVVYGLVVEEWSFVTSLYFAVSTLSTAGLQVVTDEPARVCFAGVYALFGVPMYGLTMGLGANLLLQRYLQHTQAETINAKLEKSEVQLAEKLLQTRSQGVDKSEYVVIQLMRLGLLDADLLERLSKKFDALDANKNGRIELKTFCHEYKQTPAVSKAEAEANAETDFPVAVEHAPIIPHGNVVPAPSPMLLTNPSGKADREDAAKKPASSL
eukprot:TRINITY_DN44371_c0_g1_i1.p1 TRINITY_DN44371_c0_g1~~TRINITY_DN44371_c0_g1_i1.p1  ORF type:complete len:454 (-),score=74.69 TRINITY_DN44371_c0_g1_i1:476-1837(-)